MRYTTDRLLVDTGAFIAIANKDDQYHDLATGFFVGLLESGVPLLTTNFILGETYTNIKRKAGSRAAIKFGNAVRNASAKPCHLEIHYINADIEDEAWKMFEKYSNQEFSYTDCTTFALLGKIGLKRVFAFDGHFKWMGFEMLPGLEK